jgi:prephenate dehydrogenase
VSDPAFSAAAGGASAESASLSPAVVVGAGLIGASIGRALTAAGVEVHLTDKMPSHAIVAATIGAGTTDDVRAEDVRLVVIAVPPSALVKAIAKALRKYPRATVTDVGSVKSKVLDELWSIDALDLGRYVGSHPMAGTQHSGPLTASETLFTDRTWVIAPHRASLPEATADVHRLAEVCGATIVTFDVADHDRAVATVSHVPYIMSVLTAGQLLEHTAEDLRLAGPGVRDVTRVAASDPGLWRQIIAANATAVRTELEQISARLAELLAGLDDEESVERILADGRDGTRALPGKHGLAPADFGQVVVELPDTPGSLSRLFRDVAALGVNVEDLGIEHDPVRQVGYLAISVVGEQVAEFTRAIRAVGWTVRGA